MARRFRSEVVSATSARDADRAAGEVVSWLEAAVLRPIEGPIVDLLAARRQALTVVAIGPFAGLPLHAARLADGRPAAVLGLAYAPALAALDNDVPHPARATGVLVVADPAIPGERSLAGAVRERKALADTWPDAVVLSGPAATRAAVRAALPSAALVHLACHGSSDDSEPLRSAVALADGDFTMRDVLSSRLQRGCVVVLSACETAVSDPTVPDEAMSLAGGFLAAGAGAVVASLWPIPDYPTAALMGAFHKELRAGSSPARALGAAQCAMAAGRLTDADGKDWSSPYVWAGFVALGAA
jgi:CHAT domain-containing protein